MRFLTPQKFADVAVGDTVTFTWADPAPHGVVRTSGEVCPGVDAANDVELAPTAPEGNFVWEAREAGVYWVACPVPGHCPPMLLKITVA